MFSYYIFYIFHFHLNNPYKASACIFTPQLSIIKQNVAVHVQTSVLHQY